ncbi:histidine kinase, partial [bacterium LRH843]|nr:histidine kinase [bacterium LRH843]
MELREHQKILLAELQHRVRNLLAMMRSIVRKSTDSHDTVEDYVAHLTGRIDAMGRTQVLLTRASGASVDLENLIRDELSHV